jgi:hypothetical protein
MVIISGYQSFFPILGVSGTSEPNIFYSEQSALLTRALGAWL